MGKRKSYNASFKSKVALEVIQGDMTIARLASKYGLNPNMITRWNNQAVEGMQETFLVAAILPTRPRTRPLSRNFTPRSAS